MKPSEARRILSANLLDADRLPSMAARTCETWVKRRLFRLEDRAVREELALYRAAFSDIREEAYNLRGRMGGTLDRRFMDALLPIMRARVLRLGHDVARVAGAYSVQAYVLGYYGRAWLLDMVTAPDVRVKVPPPDIRTAMRERILTEAGGANIWAMIADEYGDDWYRIFSLEYDTLMINLTRVLKQGMRQGLGMADIMDKVADKFGIELSTTGGYQSNFNVVQAVTRTYVMNSSNQGAARIFYDNRELLAGYRHLTANDERVCNICAAMDGHLYPIGEWAVPPSNTHPNCRCTIIPELRADYADIYLNDPPRETYDEWAALLGIFF